MTQKIRQQGLKNGWKKDIDKVLPQIFVIMDRPMKIIYYKPINMTIDAPSLAEFIINVIIQ